MEKEMIETNIVEKEKNDLVITTDKAKVQFSPEATEMLCAIGSDVMKNAVNAATQRYMAALQKEAELQVSTMEKTVSGQKHVMDVHERKQHDLLEKCLEEKKLWMEKMSEAESQEEKTGCMYMIEKINEQLEKLYLKNNADLDSNLEQMKQKPKGILGQIFSRFGI